MNIFREDADVEGFQRSELRQPAGAASAGMADFPHSGKIDATFLGFL
jgi:hypothetical protein